MTASCMSMPSINLLVISVMSYKRSSFSFVVIGLWSKTEKTNDLKEKILASFEEPNSSLLMLMTWEALSSLILSVSRMADFETKFWEDPCSFGMTMLSFAFFDSSSLDLELKRPLYVSLNSTVLMTLACSGMHFSMKFLKSCLLRWPNLVLGRISVKLYLWFMISITLSCFKYCLKFW